MIYSVWREELGTYDYYETPATIRDVEAPVPKHLKGGKLGVSADNARWPLPPGATKVGSGAEPRGAIARLPGEGLYYGLSGLTDTVPGGKLGLLALVGAAFYLVRRYL
jgi:hypothetical protein